MIFLDIECQDCGAMLFFAFELNVEVPYFQAIRDGPSWANDCIECNLYADRFARVVE